MTKQESKFYQICGVLKKEFNWTTIRNGGLEKKEAFLHVNGKLFWIGFNSHILTFSYGLAFSKSIDMLCENNTAEDFVLNQCEKIDKKCRSIASSY